MASKKTDVSKLSDVDLCYLTAEEAIAAFKARELSPVDVMKAVIARCEKVNPKLNAVTYNHFDRALDQAKKAEKRYASANGSVRPLEGIPLAIKDLHPVEGEICTWGSKIYEGVRADNTVPIVERLLDGLPPRQRELLRSVKLEGQSIAEAASHAGQTETAARVGIHRSLKALARKLRGEP